MSDPVGILVVDTPADLAPYVFAYYRTRIDAEGVLEDFMPPEEANLRTGTASIYRARIGSGELLDVPPAIISGPTDRGTRVNLSRGEFWGIGLTPAGWSRFIGLPASSFANRFDDLANYPSLSILNEMLLSVAAERREVGWVINRFNTTFRALLQTTPRSEEKIHAVQRELLSGKPLPTEKLASLCGMNVRTFERFCKRHFGFPPAALQRRQRFLRSLGRFMLDPSMRWIETLDPYYSDQAHFIREFRSIMGMTPGEYAAHPHPIVGAAVQVTHEAAGVAMQSLHRPKPPVLDD